MQIERATPQDAAEVLALQKLAYQSEAAIYNDDAIPPLVQTLEETLDDFSRQVVLKIVDGGRIIGSVRAYEQDGTCFIGKLIVHPECQNRGLGTRLLHEIEAIHDRAARFELFTGNKSGKNLYLYRKVGYVPFREQAISERVSLIFLEKKGKPPNDPIRQISI
jgi:ribosomal protein S18 acetylase RimI-like enzyme